MKMGYNMSEMRDEEEIRELVRLMSEAELQSMEQDETLREPAEFSEMFHRRMERLIGRQRRGYQIKKAALYILSAAAVFLVILCLTDPGRVVKAWEALVKWYRYPKHTELHVHMPEEEKGNAVPEYELTYLPEGFEAMLDEYDGTEGVIHCFKYILDGDAMTQQSISLVYGSSNAHSYFQNGEAASRGKDKEGNEVFCVKEEDGRISLLWYSEKDKLTFLLLGTDSTEEDLFRVKDGIREKKTAEWEAPSSYREEVSDNLSFDAEVVVSDSFRNGIFYKTKGQYQEYDEDAAFEIFFGKKEIEDRITYEMPDRSGAEKEGYAYQSEDGCSLCLYPAQVSYSVNAEADHYFYGFCDTVGNTTMYNAGSYSLTEELDFMTRDEAKRKVQEILEKIGLFPGEFTCQAYALDAPTLCEESRRVYEWGFEEGDVDFRTEWGKEQEAYAFRIWQVCQGLPVWTAEIGPLYVADGSKAPVTGIYRKDGLVSLTVTDILDFETTEEYEVLLPFRELVGKISENYQDGEDEGKVIIKEIRLCALIIGKEGGECTVAPVWICTGEQAEDGYPVQRTFDAVTGEEIGGN